MVQEDSPGDHYRYQHHIQCRMQNLQERIVATGQVPPVIPSFGVETVAPANTIIARIARASNRRQRRVIAIMSRRTLQTSTVRLRTKIGLISSNVTSNRMNCARRQ